MTIRGILGFIILAFGAYIWKGEPEKATWPMALGHWCVAFIKFCVEQRPYTIVISIVLALTLFMTVKKP